MKRRKIAIVLIAAMVLTFSLAACGGGGDAGGGGGTTLIIQDSSWEGVDMFQCQSWNDMQALIADPILEKDVETGAPLPCIASESVWSEDGMTWTLTIPEGMYYSTGEQVEPEDIIGSLEYGKEVSQYADGYDNIESMEVDGRNVVIHLKEFKADMEYNFQSCFIGVIDKDELDTMSKDELLWGCHPYGAYAIDQYEAGAYVTLKANEGYATNNPMVENKGKMPIETVKVVFSGEAFTWAEGIKNGDYDVLPSVPMEYYDDLTGNKDITTVDCGGAQLYYAEMNMTDPLFTDINVRKAIVMGINQDNLSTYVSSDNTPAYSIILPKCLNYDPAVEEWYKTNYPYDPEAAKQLLADAGWTDTDGDGIVDKDGVKFQFTFSSRDTESSKNSAQSMQADLKQIGVQMDITTQDWSYVNQDVVDGNFQMAFLGLGWSEPFLLMDMFCQRNAECTNPDPAGQEEMVAAARLTVDFDERTPQITALQEKILDYCTLVPLLSNTGYRCWRSEIAGIKTTPTGGFYLADVVVDENGNFRNVGN